MTNTSTNTSVLTTMLATKKWKAEFLESSFRNACISHNILPRALLVKMKESMQSFGLDVSEGLFDAMEKNGREAVSKSLSAIMETSVLQPTLHKPVPMGSRVKVPKYFHSSSAELWGEVVGISFAHVIFGYIVLLDEPLETLYGPQKAVVVNGPELEGPDGTNWRLDNE